MCFKIVDKGYGDDIEKDLNAYLDNDWHEEMEEDDENELEFEQPIDTQMSYDTVLAAVFSKCKEGSIVAFKSKDNGEWYTGYIQSLFIPNGKYNKSNVWSVSICIYCPISPQWYEDDDKIIYYYEDITNAVLLENAL